MTTRALEVPKAADITGTADELKLRIVIVDGDTDTADPAVIYDAGATEITSGEVWVTAGDAATTQDLKTQDSLAEGSYYRLEIFDSGQLLRTIHGCQIPAGAGTYPWEDFTAPGVTTEPEDIWQARLLPSDPDDGDVPVWSDADDAWIATALSGTAADIDQYDVAARLGAGTGSYSGVAAGDLTEETSPAAGDFLLGWESGGALRKFDIGDLVQPPASDGNYYAYKDGAWVNITNKIINP